MARTWQPRAADTDCVPKTRLFSEVLRDALEVPLDNLGHIPLETAGADVHGHEVHASPRCGWAGRMPRRSRGGLGKREAGHGGRAAVKRRKAAS